MFAHACKTLILFSLIPLAGALSGCLGGEGDTSTVMVPDTDTAGTHEEIHLPAWKVGDKWVLALHDSSTDTSVDLQTTTVTKVDAMYRGAEVYEASVVMTTPDYIDAQGNQYKNFSSASKTYMRKPDEETVYNLSTITFNQIPVGSTVESSVKVVYEDSIDITGQSPTTLKYGMAWTIKYTDRSHEVFYVDDVDEEDRDTVETETLSYQAKNVSTISVPAGSFKAIALDYSVTETGDQAIQYLSEEARGLIKESSIVGGKAFTRVDMTSVVLTP